MSSNPLKSFQPPSFGLDLVSRAASLLTAEAMRLQPMSTLPGEAQPFGMSTLNTGDAPSDAACKVVDVENGAPQADPIATALASNRADELRRQAAQLLETLLGALAQGKHSTEASNEDRVPLVRALAPVNAGSLALASIRVTNEETAPSSVSLYTTNLVADSGYELPSLLVSIAPRCATIPPRGTATFEIKVSVPAQAPPGFYSGLVQATGCKYVKAVVMFEVL
jgi:hypothetical protein